MSDETTLNVKGLDQLLKSLKQQRPPTARVGILGDKNNRSPKPGGHTTPTNSEIGAVHEYGSPARNIPARSFLRVPIADNLDKRMENSNLFNSDVLAEVIKEGSVAPWLKAVAAIAEGIVGDAFATGGFGKWAPWRDPGYTNNTGDLLVDTGQLSRSITSEVKE